MPPSDYEIYRQRLEEQLRADVELLYEAYRAKLRAYETVLRTRGEIGAGPWPPPELTLSLPPASRLEASPAPPAPSKRPRSRAYSLIEAVEGVLDTLDEVFDRNDLIRALGFEPNRATLHRVPDRAYGRRHPRRRTLRRWQEPQPLPPDRLLFPAGEGPRDTRKGWMRHDLPF